MHYLLIVSPYSKKLNPEMQKLNTISGELNIMLMELKKIIIKLFRCFKASAEQGNAKDQNNPEIVIIMVKV